MRKFFKYAITAITVPCLFVGAHKVVEYTSVPIVEELIETDTRKQSELWLRRVVLHLENPSLTFEDGLLLVEDQRFLELMPEASNIYRVSLYDKNGEAIWSTETDDIGNSLPQLAAAELSAGRSTYIRQQQKAEEINGLALHALDQSTMLHEVAEIFAPVVIDGRVIGAVEFFTDITETRATFLHRVRLLLSVLTAIALIVMTVVSTIVYRSNQGRYKALEQRSITEKEMLGEQLRLARDVKLLGELNEWLQSSRSLDELFDMVGRFMTHILPNAEGSVYVYSNSRDVLDGMASWNGGTHKDHIQPDECWGLRRGRTYEYGTSEINFTCAHAEPHNGNPYFCFPILAHGETVGLLHLRSKENCAEAFYADRELAQMSAEQISMAIANVRMRDELHDRSVRDPLTGLFNRRHMTETLRKSISDCERSGHSFAVVAIDVDHFKKFNDTHGHDAGDMVLRAVGSALQQDCDGDDMACRPGGEEFTVILSNCNVEEALARAEVQRRAVEAIKVRYGEKTLPRITISVGVSHYPEHGTMPQMLLRAADDALYQAKAQGRNRVVLAEGFDMAQDGLAARRETNADKDWEETAKKEISYDNRHGTDTCETVEKKAG